MADYYSAMITNLDATPPAPASALVHSSPVRCSFGVYETTDATLGTSDSIRIARLPAQGYLLGCWFAFDDFGSTGDFNIGFHKPTYAGGTAIDANAIGTAVDVNAAAVALTNYRYETLAIDTMDDPIWDLATLTAAPAYHDIDISITPSEVTTAVGTIAWEIYYTDAV